jgi:O-antigen/teichoic acid export membrane protein
MGIVRNQSIKNSIYIYIGLFFGAISTIIFYPNAFNSHPEHLGLLQIIIAYSTVVSTFSFLGAPKTIIRFFPRFENKNELITLAFLIPIVGFLLVLFSYFLFKDIFLNIINADELLTKYFHLVFFMLFFLSFFEVFSALSRSLLNATIPIFLREIFLKGVAIILLFLHWFDYIDFSSFLYLYISIYLGMVIILSYSIFKDFRYRITMRFNEINIRELLTYGAFVLVGGASSILVSKVDMMMIAKLMDLKQVAYYTIAFFIGNVILMPARSIGSIISPLLAQAWENNDVNKIDNIYKKSSLNQLLFGGFIFLAVWLNIDEGLSLLPDKFRGGKYVVLYISLSKLYSISTGVTSQIIINSRFYRFDLYSNIILLGITILSNYIFIPESSPLFEYDIVGINGAAFATALSVIIFNTFKMIFVKIKIGIQPFTFQTFKAVALIILTYYIVNIIPFSDNIFYAILLRSGLILLIFLPLMLLLHISEDINKLVVDIRKRLGI